MSSTSHLSDSTHSLSQSRQCLCTDGMDMMSCVYRYFLSVIVIFLPYTATLPTVLTDIIELYK